jgi:hypothetical protein
MIIFDFQKLLRRMSGPATWRDTSRSGPPDGASAVWNVHEKPRRPNANTYLTNCYFLFFIHIGEAAAPKGPSLLRSAGGHWRKALPVDP